MAAFLFLRIRNAKTRIARRKRGPRASIAVLKSFILYFRKAPRCKRLRVYSRRTDLRFYNRQKSDYFTRFSAHAKRFAEGKMYRGIGREKEIQPENTFEKRYKIKYFPPQKSRRY